jgi:ubiquinone/menaquinone biosynthesis C-methylase UbiE
VFEKLQNKLGTFATLVQQRDWRGVGHRLADHAPWLPGSLWLYCLPVGSRARMFQRSQYKEVWTIASTNEDTAKISISGSADEAEFLRTGQGTVFLLQKMVGIHPTDTILEIGAGVGRSGSLIAPLCQQWIGADVSENMLAHLRRRLSHLPNIRTVPLNGYDLSPIPSSSIDLVYCTVVFMHLDEWDRFNYVREAFRVLKPGGRVYIDNFDLTSDEGWGLFSELLIVPPAERPAAIGKSSTPIELQTYLTRAGFQNIATERGGLFVSCAGVKPT